MADPALIAQLDFTPVPSSEREVPGRVRSIPARLYVDKYVEHREAFEFLQSMDVHGEASKTLVKAILHYRDTVLTPLEQHKRKAPKARPQRRNQMPPADLLLAAQRSFTPVPAGERQAGRVRHASARLYIDKYIEHREAHEVLQAQQELHGEGLKTLVRALLHYRDTVIRPLEEARANGGQMRLG